MCPPPSCFKSHNFALSLHRDLTFAFRAVFYAVMNTPLILSCALLLAGQAHAQSAQDAAGIEVIPGWETPGGTYFAGLKISLKDGWKTYWRAPGDAGIPPRFDWTGSENIAQVALHWPTPEVFQTSGYQTIGYKQSVVIPIELGPNADGGQMHLEGRIDMGVCKDICLPLNLSFEMTVPLNGGPNAEIAGALMDQPMTASRASVRGVTCNATPIKDGLRLTSSIRMPELSANEVVVVEVMQPGLWISEAVTLRTGDTLSATADIVPLTPGGFALERSKVRYTVIGDNEAVDIIGCTGS